MNRRDWNAPDVFFFACFLPLFAADLARILVMYYYSNDRGMWPLALFFLCGFSFFYSALVYLAAHLTRQYPVMLAAIHHGVLGAVLVSFSLIAHIAEPDWLAVKRGMAEPTPFLAVIYSDATWWIIYLFFYLVLIYRLVRLRLRD